MKGVRLVMVSGAMVILLAGVGLAQTSGDFIPQNVEFIKKSRTYAKVKGELTNNSGRSISHAEFLIHAYDTSGNLINSASFTIMNFVKGTTRSFNTTIQADARKISSHKVEPKHKRVRAIQSGRDFIPQTVDFVKSSRSYTKTMGKLSNNSGTNWRQANFIIHVYDTAGNLINSTPFIIRNILHGRTKEFNTTIQANVSKISSYKIEFKGGTEIPPSP